ncbi:MAG: DUF2281 domain-containing protein [Betaproteobacteria bacterium]|nr:DUF2281 domain-containing protein [Betaproteobacteria bacterium]
MTAADQISEEVKALPEELAAEVLDFVRFLKTRQAWRPRLASADALEMLDHPPLDLGEQYLSRDQCHDRAGLR